MRAQTGAFDSINFQGMTETASFEMLPPNMCLFSSALSSGSSFGELYACGEKWNKANSRLRRDVFFLRGASYQPNAFKTKGSTNSGVLSQTDSFTHTTYKKRIGMHIRLVRG